MAAAVASGRKPTSSATASTRLVIRVPPGPERALGKAIVRVLHCQQPIE